MDNARLQIERLSLFVAEAERLLRQVEEASNETIRKDRLQALVTLARNIGATRLAELSRRIVAMPEIGEDELGELRRTVRDVIAYVQQTVG